MGYPVLIDFKPYETEAEIQTYLDETLDLQFLKPDKALVQGLDSLIGAFRPDRKSLRQGLLVTDLLSTSYFRSLNAEALAEFKSRVNNMIEVETFYRSRGKYRLREAKALNKG